MKKSYPQQGLTSEEASRATGVPPNNLRRHNTPEVAAKLREGFPDPTEALRHDATTVLPALVKALERQNQALERIAKELSQIRQEVKKPLAKAQTSWQDDNLPF